jgi:hypothetical protein
MAVVVPDSGLLIWMLVIAGLLVGLGIFVGIIIYRSLRKKKY